MDSENLELPELIQTDEALDKDAVLYSVQGEPDKRFHLTRRQYGLYQELRDKKNLQNFVVAKMQQAKRVGFTEIYTLLKTLHQQGLVLPLQIIQSLRAMDGTRTSLSASWDEPKLTQNGFSFNEFSKLPLFRNLKREVQEMLFKTANFYKLGPDRILIRQGDADRSLFVLVSGELNIYAKRVHGGKAHYELLSQVQAPHVFGERGFFLGGARGAEIVSQGNVEILKIPYLDYFSQSLQSQPLVQTLIGYIWVYNALSLNPLFRDLPGEIMDQVAGLGMWHELVKGNFLFRQNDPAKAFYILIEGQILLRQNGNVLGFVRQGECLGEVSMLMATGGRTAEALALENTLLLEVSQENFFRLLTKNLALAARLEALAEARLKNDSNR